MKPRAKMIVTNGKVVGVPEESTELEKVIMAAAKEIVVANGKSVGKSLIIPEYKKMAFTIKHKVPLGAKKGVDYGGGVFYNFYSYIVDFELPALIEKYATGGKTAGMKKTKICGTVNFEDCLNDHGFQDVEVKSIALN